jgi:curved DNA-binding protein CbpA
VSLYEDLGVSPDADDATIKRAYRKRAAKAHPDAGGSREEFEKVSKAKLILLDPRRRQRYDATGEADAAPDNELAEALNIAVSAIDNVLRVCERRHADPCEFQIVEDALTGLANDIEAQEAHIREIDKMITTLSRIAERMRSKSGKPNRLRPIFEARVGDKQREKAAKKRAIDLMKKAYEVLNEHEFSAVAMQAIGYY